jgi:hypothetical protein
MSIAAALRSRSPIFDRLASVSAVLDEAVSPTTGLGLTEIWTHLFAPKTIEVSLAEIRGLEHATRQPYKGLNQHGMYFLFTLNAFLSIFHSPPQANSRRFISLYASPHERSNHWL